MTHDEYTAAYMDRFMANRAEKARREAQATKPAPTTLESNCDDKK
jgi:hypothetical protein